jgi:hypothetical protein
MPENKPEEEPRLKARRKLLKLAAYSIPVITSILATEEALAQAQTKFKRKITDKNKNRPSGFS